SPAWTGTAAALAAPPWSSGTFCWAWPNGRLRPEPESPAYRVSGRSEMRSRLPGAVHKSYTSLITRAGPGRRAGEVFGAQLQENIDFTDGGAAAVVPGVAL